MSTEKQIAGFFVELKVDMDQDQSSQEAISLLKQGKVKDAKKVIQNQVGKKAFLKMEPTINKLFNEQQLSEGQSLLSKICQSKQQYLSLKKKLQSKVFLQDMIECVSQKTGKFHAKQIANLIYKEDGKANIKTNSLQRFYSECSKLKISDQKIDKIKHLVRNGKRQAIIRFLISQCAETNGNFLYQFAKNDIPQIHQKPKAGSSQLKEENGIKIRKYQSSLSHTEKSRAKNIMVLGQTGCGKSTFINSLANYLLGVQIDDPWRYYIIVEKQQDQTQSVTQTITDYYIKDQYTGNVYRLIDTPGFGDTKGVKKDNQIVELIREKFKNDLEVIHCVLFVMKASNVRVGPYHKYVFDSVIDLFDKSIAPNFTMILTFSDSGKPSVLSHLMDQKLGFGKYWNQLAEPKYIKVNSCATFQKIEIKDKEKVDSWNSSLQHIKSLFFKINTIQAKSMKLSKELIYKKQNLSNQISTTYKTIQQSIANRQNIIIYIETIISCAQQMDNNKSFERTIQEFYYQSVTYNGNVTQCRAKRQCMENSCHINCSFSKGPQKQFCCAMIDGKCTVCGCHWSSHINQNTVQQRRTRDVKVTDQILKNKFEKYEKDRSLSEIALSVKIEELQYEMKVIAVAIGKMESLQKDLQKMQMSNTKPQSTKEYLQILIKNQQYSKQPGYQQRVMLLSKQKDVVELYQNVCKGQYDQKQKLERSIRQMKIKFAQKIKSSVSSSMWQKLKNFFK